MFWVSLVSLFYIYIGYPAIMLLVARLFPRPIRKGDYRASISVLISVYREADKLVEKLSSIFESDGSDMICEIIIGSDGSPDDVEGAVARLADSRVRVVRFPERRGKASVLNDLMQVARGEIIVMTDARQRVGPGALKALLSNFADPDVGVVSGELVFIRDDLSIAGEGIDAYWRYEKAIRKAESAVGSVPGATGALYAIRRELLKPIPPETVLDDVAIPIQAIMQGARCVLEPGAIVVDRPSRDVHAESLRKRRTIGGVLQLVWLFPHLLSPVANPVWFAFVSHKLARLASPFFLMAAMIANAWLLDTLIYRVTGIAQALAYTTAIVGGFWVRDGKANRILSASYMFIMLNLNTLQAIFDVALGRLTVRWERETANG